MKYTDFKKSNEVGLSSERQFSNLALSRGFETRESSKYENMIKHVDVFMRKNKRIYSVDVKAPKKNLRSSKVFSNNKTWIELMNVSGNTGWLYGEQDYIAFDLEDRFIIVKTNELRGYIETVVALEEEITSDIRKSDYGLYRRSNYGRKDIITRIETRDLYMLEHKIWMKPLRLN